MLLSEAIEELCIATRANGRSRRTIDTYREKIRPLVKYLGDVDVESVTTSHLRGWVVSMMDRQVVYEDHQQHAPRARPLSEHTVFSRLRHVKRLFRFLVDEGVLLKDPAAAIELRKPSRDEPKGVSIEDFLRLIGVDCHDALCYRDTAMIVMLFDTGCRVGGLCGLKWSDVDFDQQWMSLKEKGKKTRVVPFSDVTTEALDSWRGSYSRETGNLLGGDDRVFVNRRGKPMTPNGVLQAIKRRGELVGCTGPINPHAFRHGFARQFLLDGGDLATLSKLLGHSDSKITTDYYAIFTAAELQEKHRKHSPVLQALRRSCRDEESE